MDGWGLYSGAMDLVIDSMIACFCQNFWPVHNKGWVLLYLNYIFIFFTFTYLFIYVTAVQVQLPPFSPQHSLPSLSYILIFKNGKKFAIMVSTKYYKRILNF